MKRPVGKKKWIAAGGTVILLCSIALGFLAVGGTEKQENKKETPSVKESIPTREKKVEKKAKKEKEKDEVNQILNRYGIDEVEQEWIPKADNTNQRLLLATATLEEVKKEEAKEKEILPPTLPLPPVEEIKPVIPKPEITSTPKISYSEQNIVRKNSVVSVLDYIEVTDELDPDVIVSYDSVDTSFVGRQYVNVTAINKFGRSATVTLTFIVSNVPDLRLKDSEVTISIGSLFAANQYIDYAEDELDGEITTNVLCDTSQLNTEKEGTYIVYYTVANSCGFQATAEMKVVVKNEAPTFFADPVYLSLNEEFDPLDGVKAYSYSGEEIVVTNDDIVENTVDIHQEGEYVVKYQVKDKYGKESSIFERKVYVGNTAPVISGTGDVVTQVGQPISVDELLAYVSVWDKEDEELGETTHLTVDLDEYNQIDFLTPGEYPLTYIATDSQGKVSKVTIKIIVQEIDNQDKSSSNEVLSTPVISSEDKEISLSNDKE